MADPSAELRRIEISSKLFGGYHTYIRLDDFKCLCEVEDHVVALLSAQLSELNLNNLIDKLLKVDFDIHGELEDIMKQDPSKTIWMCDHSDVKDDLAKMIIED